MSDLLDDGLVSHIGRHDGYVTTRQRSKVGNCDCEVVEPISRVVSLVVVLVPKISVHGEVFNLWPV